MQSCRVSVSAGLVEDSVGKCGDKSRVSINTHTHKHTHGLPHMHLTQDKVHHGCFVLMRLGEQNQVNTQLHDCDELQMCAEFWTRGTWKCVCSVSEDSDSVSYLTVTFPQWKLTVHSIR